MKYNHALALYPYFRDSTSIVGLFPPTGIEYIATSMKDLVGKVTLLDLRHEKEFQDINNLRDFVKREIDLLCISIIWSYGFKEICELISKFPDEIPIVVGGYKATEEVEYLFEKCPNIDVIVRGEGEETIKELIKGLPYKDILGISYRETCIDQSQRNGKIVHNKNRPLTDVNTIPFPDRSLRNITYHFVSHGVKITNLTFDTILTTRGCPYKCKFCTFSLNPLGQKREYIERSLESVIEELKTISADIVLFSDDNFFTNPKRSEKLCDLIIENNIKKRFIVQTRIEITRQLQLLKKAEKAGFKVFLVGIESPHDRILKQIQKGFTQQKIREAFKVFNRFNFYIHGYFIYGNIGETEEEMVYIAEFAKDLKLDSITFQKLRIERYSPLAELIAKMPCYHYDEFGGPLYSDQFTLEKLKKIRDRIKFSFYNMRQIKNIIKKAYKIGLLTTPDFILFSLSLPMLIFKMIKREIQKKKGFAFIRS